jgi:hypothetical protein
MIVNKFLMKTIITDETLQGSFEIAKDQMKNNTIRTKRIIKNIDKFFKDNFAYHYLNNILFSISTNNCRLSYDNLQSLELIYAADFQFPIKVYKEIESLEISILIEYIINIYSTQYRDIMNTILKKYNMNTTSIAIHYNTNLKFEMHYEVAMYGGDLYDDVCNRIKFMKTNKHGKYIL